MTHGYLVPDGSLYGLAGSAEGDRLRDNFYAYLAGLGDMRLLWTPEVGDTTTSTSRDRHGVTVTYSKSIATWDDAGPLNQGSGLYAHFDGTDEEADTPDNSRYSFGDGAVDSPFTIVALVNPDTVNAVRSIFSKENSAAVEEYDFHMDANGYPSVRLQDESATAYIGREDQTALVAGAWVLLSFTYDGSGANTGIKIFRDSVRVDDADESSGTYVAMENTAALPVIGARYTTKEQFWDGGKAFVGLWAAELRVHTQWAIKERVNALYDLAL